MTKHTRQLAPDERAAIASDLMINTAPPPLQSTTLHTFESYMLSQENIATQRSLPVQTTKSRRYTQKTPGPHPTTLKKTVTQLSLPMTQTYPQPHHIQHTTKDPQRHTYISPTHITQHPLPLNSPTIREEATKRHNITREKRKP